MASNVIDPWDLRSETGRTFHEVNEAKETEQKGCKQKWLSFRVGEQKRISKVRKLARLVIHSSKDPGTVLPSLFRGDLQQALHAGPVPPLLETMEYDGVHLQDLMIAPFRLHPTEHFYRALGIDGQDSDAAARKSPIWDMVAGFLEGCASALVRAAAEALQDLGQDVETGGRELLDQLIRCHVDAIVARHLGALRAMRVFEVIRRAAEQTISSKTARLCTKMKRGRQRTWGVPNGHGQKSKMMRVEEACRGLAEIGRNKEIELFMMLLKPTFSNIRVDIKNLPHQLDPRELLTLIKPARLAARASLLARSHSLQTKFARLLSVERGQTEPEHAEGDGREWTFIETRDLLNCLNRAFEDSAKSRDAALERGLENPEVREAAAGRSLEGMIAYVRQLEGLFSAADQGGLKFAEDSFEAAVRAREKGGSGRDAWRNGLPEDYVREDSDILQLLKAVTQFYHRSRGILTLRARKAADREVIAGILNRAQARKKAKRIQAEEKIPRSDVRSTEKASESMTDRTREADEQAQENGAVGLMGDQSGAGPEGRNGNRNGSENGNGIGNGLGIRGASGGDCMGQRFEKQIWDESEGMFVVKRGIILRGPIVSKARMVTRQSVFEVRYDGGRTGEVSLRPEERNSGTDRKLVPRGSLGSDGSGDRPSVGEEGSCSGNGKRKRITDGNETGCGDMNSSGNLNGNGNENGSGNGAAPKRWQALEVGWCLERLCALYGASADAFRTALRDYEASALPDGVRIQYKPRKTGDRVDKYYWYGDFRTDSLVKLQQFFDELSGAECAPKPKARAPPSCGKGVQKPKTRAQEEGGRGSRPQLTPAQKKEVKERMEEERWPNYTSERQEGRTAGKVDCY
ncbi:hypothetical protein KFL_002410140 [Klebsormidium nitens]|uniref:MBD domain-containing protein n=1 Tax=Klebsormidium nitens TaxID=105231 RepID=A0A1Y1I4Y9_KLENI|nr:hypothetical protein KFL_002410140 [Klebsormidium nitens]|eukprot:GAQ85563.1 hypothetical protein KFL_002410140 [Klebsormidium nitens]